MEEHDGADEKDANGGDRCGIGLDGSHGYLIYVSLLRVAK
jgi:hypothetical protein